MTENEAIYDLKFIKEGYENLARNGADSYRAVGKGVDCSVQVKTNEDLYKHYADTMNIAIQSLKEIQQYRAIGTIKEIKIREAQFARLSEGYLSDLTSLREYQAIGTVEEFKALKEKSVAKKPTNKHKRFDVMGFCPSCKMDVYYPSQTHYCSHCGQKLDWSD